MSDNELVKTVIAAATFTGLAAGINWVAKKVVKESFTSDPCSSPMNYAKFTAVMAGGTALKQYLDDQKILPISEEKRSIEKGLCYIKLLYCCGPWQVSRLRLVGLW